MALDKASAQKIAAAIRDVILRMGLSTEDAKAQCYDGCSTMTGSSLFTTGAGPKRQKRKT